jgi:hypothetical protein
MVHETLKPGIICIISEVICNQAENYTQTQEKVKITNSDQFHYSYQEYKDKRRANTDPCAHQICILKIFLRKHFKFSDCLDGINFSLTTGWRKHELLIKLSLKVFSF